MKLNRSILFVLLTGCVIVAQFFGGRFLLKSNDQPLKYWEARVAEVEHFLDAELLKVDQLNSQRTPEGWEFIQYQDSVPVNWSSNGFTPDIHLVNEHFLHSGILDNDFKVVLYHLVKNDNQWTFYWKPLLNRALGSFEKQQFIPVAGKDYDIRKDQSGFPIECNGYKTNYTISFSINQTGGFGYYLIILLPFLFLLATLFIGNKPWQYFLIGVLAFIWRCFLYENTGISFLTSNVFFNPAIYASSYLLPSLADLILHVITALLVLPFLYYGVKTLFFKIGELNLSWMVKLVFAILFFFSVDLVFSICKGLVMDSNIDFNPLRFLSNLEFTPWAFVVMATLWWLHHLFFYKVSSVITSSKKQWVIFICLGSIAFILFQIIDGHRSFISLTPVLIFGFIHLLIIFKVKSSWVRVVMPLFISLFLSLYLWKFFLGHEREHTAIIAGKLVSDKDINTERQLLGIEAELANEFLKPADFNAAVEQKLEIENRLKSLFFSGYLNKYRLLIFTYDSTGRNLNQSGYYNYNELNELYNYHTYPSMSNYFYQITDPEGINGYIAKFENCDTAGRYGHVFVVLEPRLLQEGQVYQRVLTKQTLSPYPVDHYHYAIYRQDKLVKQKGEFPYALKYKTPTEIKSGFTHYVFEEQVFNKVVISRPQRFPFFVLAWFTLLLLQLLLIIFVSDLALSLRRVAQQKQWKLNGIFSLNVQLLSSKVQILVLSLVLIAMLATAVLSVQYIRYNFKEQQEQQAVEKARDLANELQYDIESVQGTCTKDYFQAAVNRLSDLFKLDVNLYDTSGLLVSTSSEKIYELGVLGEIMNPAAYQLLKNQNTSQWFMTERLKDKSYPSIYLPVSTRDGTINMYLHIPFLNQNDELAEEVSTFILTFLTLFLLLALLALVVAYVSTSSITRPLVELRENFGRISLSHKNETIQYTQNDEIGQLVAEYNKTVLALEAAAKKLADSERESAWKEMAKQVAHEIKNPLTPMKLNIQHLQRTWEVKHENMDATFQRVTKVLIEQIDNLSAMASEFSNFAKMPKDAFEVINICDILDSVVHLFQESKEVEISYKSTQEEIKVYGDPSQISRVFSNLIKNAIQAIPEDREGKVDITIERIGKEVRIQIKDNGSGIDDAVSDKIFKPNFSTKNSGMGMGLAICKKIVETANGTITYESTPMVGTTFTVLFPIFISSEA